MPAIAVATILVGLVAVVFAAPRAGFSAWFNETFELLTWQSGELRLGDEGGHLPLALGLLGLVALGSAAWLVFRPLAAPRALPDPEVRHAVEELVRRHGHDTLAFFKLRGDQQYLFTDDGAAFLGYRVEGGVMLCAGDPVGPTAAMPALLDKAAAFAQVRGLRLGAVAVSAGAAPAFEALGLRRLYLGDEAIVETGAVLARGPCDSQGAPVRDPNRESRVHPLDGDAVRRARTRRWASSSASRRPGARASTSAASRWRSSGSVVPTSTTPSSRSPVTPRVTSRGFLHFVPSYGREAVSLSFMRRDPETPNGLTEFLVARSIEAFRERGTEEVSLNFAAFARLLTEPENAFERAAARVLRWADAWFQIESLYRFNAKFDPRWEPRYVLYEGRLGLARAGLAAAWAEGQIPKPLARR